jgi:predicted PurR-regulated permease PerM
VSSKTQPSISLVDEAAIVPLDSKPQDSLPSLPEIQTVFLGGLFVMSVLAACYVAAAIILPIVLAFVFKLVLQPVMRVLTKLHMPRSLAALVIILLLFGSIIALGEALSTPAASWTRQFTDSMPMIERRLSFMVQPMATMQGVLHNADGLAQNAGQKAVTVAVEGSRLSDRLLTNTRSFVIGTFQTILMVFFLLTAGDTFLRRLVEILPRFQDKRQAVAISQHVESDISAYLATITIMNAAVGFATGLTMMFCKIGDPVLWGVAAFLLNYIPIMGPVAGMVIFATVGLLSDKGLLPALLPAGLYFVIHLVESVYITPHFLARRFTLNPVLVMLALIFWYWMWGVPGAILSTPLLAITKIICDHIPMLAPLGHFMEGEVRSETSQDPQAA